MKLSFGHMSITSDIMGVPICACSWFAANGDFSERLPDIAE